MSPFICSLGSKMQAHRRAADYYSGISFSENWYSSFLEQFKFLRKCKKKFQSLAKKEKKNNKSHAS